MHNIEFLAPNLRQRERRCGFSEGEGRQVFQPALLHRMLLKELMALPSPLLLLVHFSLLNHTWRFIDFNLQLTYWVPRHVAKFHFWRWVCHGLWVSSVLILCSESWSSSLFHMAECVCVFKLMFFSFLLDRGYRMNLRLTFPDSWLLRNLCVIDYWGFCGFQNIKEWSFHVV